MHSGIFRLTPVFFAQFITSSSLMASFGLTFKLMTTLVDLSKAPFYSKLPKLAKSFNSDFDKAFHLIRKRFFLSLLLFSITVIFVGLFGSKILILLESKTKLCSDLFWACLGVGFFVERYSAMHLNIYTLSTQIGGHTMYFVSGLLYIIFMSLFINIFSENYKLFAFPLSLLFSELFFSSWYSSKYSIKLLKTSFFDFEIKSSFMPLIIILCYLIYVIYRLVFKMINKNKIEKILAFLQKNNFLFDENVCLKTFSYFKTGGLVKLIVYPKTEDEVCLFIKFCFEMNIDYKTIGDTSNLLFLDDKIYGLFLSLKNFNSIEKKDNSILAFAGASLPGLSRKALLWELSGFEGLEGIPGSIGGAIIMNAGAYGDEIKDHLIKVSGFKKR